MGTYQGVFRSFHTPTSTPGVYGTSPTSFRLRQNYPNPFNPSTTIGFSLPRSGEVSLKIFNPLGEEVATLTSGHMDAGVHSIEWNATGQPSGVYFYRLQAGSCAETRKLVLVR
jgi:glucuronoarabinoxylan endo-1,4-beta-xylanase